MIAKQIIGGGFRGAIEYLRNGRGGRESERGKVLDTNLPVADFSPRAFAASFGVFRKLNEKLGRAVYHVSLSPAPGDVLTDDQWREIAAAYLTGMGFEGCGYVLIKHEDEADGASVRPPHVHLLACRIRPDGTTVSDQNNYRRSEKLVREIEARYGLKEVATKERKQQPKENDMQENRNSRDAQRWLESAASQVDQVSSVQAVVECAATPSGILTDSVRRDYKREILNAEYQGMVRDIFADQIRYVRRSKQGLNLLFNQGGRVLDTGDKVAAYGMGSSLAAEAIIELAILKGWPSVVLSGDKEFLHAAFVIAMAKGLFVVPQPEQMQIYIQAQYDHVKRQGGGASAAGSPACIQPAKPVLPHLQSMSGLSGINNRRLSQEGGDIDSAPIPKP